MISDSCIRTRLVRLLILIAVAVAAFFGTRAFAAATHELRREDAARWFAEGHQALNSGDVPVAIERLRRAVSRDPDRMDYSLTLARALSAAHQDNEAEEVLSNLRDRAPEDPDINLQLARLEARRGDAVDARRYYQAAVNALWSPEQADRRRQIRVELVRFLLAQGDTKRAISELLTQSASIGDDPRAELETARLFLNAGDAAHARELFGRVLAKDRSDNAANAGAGEAAFDVGDYAAARQLLAAVPDRTPALEEMRATADAVMTGDPLAPRLPSVERRRRLQDAMDRVRARAAACGVPSPSELDDLETMLKTHRVLDASDLEGALELLIRTERATDRCPGASPGDKALVIIARRHGIDTQ